MKEKGTRNAIVERKTIIERAIEMQRDLYICYIDFLKAFGMMEHIKLMKILEDIGFDGNDKRIIRNVY